MGFGCCVPLLADSTNRRRERLIRLVGCLLCFSLSVFSYWLGFVFVG
jgi:hypothetical protein